MDKKLPKSKKPQPVAAKAEPVSPAISWLENPWIPYILCAITFVVYYLYSQKSQGFYQHDEIAHYFNMRDFFNHPDKAMNNWGKPGYKLIYSIPALLGWRAMVLFNILVSVCGCMLAYRTAAFFDKKAGIVAFVLLATQPFWVELSFRNYVDPVSGTLLLLSVYLYLKDKLLFSALVLSYSILARQEFLLMALPYGLFLLWKKKWIPALALGLFPLIYAFLTLAVKDDFFWMITETRDALVWYNEEFSRQGFDHYLIMSAVVFGAAVVCYMGLFVYQYVFNLISRSPFTFEHAKKIHLLLIPALMYFFIHCLFNFKAVQIGTATGGNLRYMMATAPAFAVLAALGLFHTPRKLWSILFLVLITVLAYFFLSYQHNHVRFIENAKKEPVRDNLLFLFFLLAGIIWAANPGKGLKTILVSALAVIIAAVSLKPFKLSNEDLAIQKMIRWSIQNTRIGSVPVYANHIMINYFYNLEENKPLPRLATIDSSVTTAPAGSLILWETHYGYRPKMGLGIPPDSLLQHPETFRVLSNEVSKDQRFQIVAFEKIK